MKFKNTQVWGFEHAFRGMRNPLNSWEKSDSKNYFVGNFVIGKNDLELAKKLIKAGSEHRKFLRQIFCSVDIEASLFFFKEFDTYKIGTTSNSTSTMHTLVNEPITIDSFEVDDYEPYLIFENKIDDSGDTVSENNFAVCDVIGINENSFFPEYTYIGFLESLRQKYLETNDKRYWKELIRWLPESWLQTRTVTMNYENIYTIIKQRKNHKLNEWSGLDYPKNENFISWALSLPYVKELFLESGDNEN